MKTQKLINKLDIRLSYATPNTKTYEVYQLAISRLKLAEMIVDQLKQTYPFLERLSDLNNEESTEMQDSASFILINSKELLKEWSK